MKYTEALAANLPMRRDPVAVRVEQISKATRLDAGDWYSVGENGYAVNLRVAAAAAIGRHDMLADDWEVMDEAFHRRERERREKAVDYSCPGPYCVCTGCLSARSRSASVAKDGRVEQRAAGTTRYGTVSKVRADRRASRIAWDGGGSEYCFWTTFDPAGPDAPPPPSHRWFEHVLSDQLVCACGAITETTVPRQSLEGRLIAECWASLAGSPLSARLARLEAPVEAGGIVAAAEGKEAEAGAVRTTITIGCRFPGCGRPSNSDLGLPFRCDEHADRELHVHGPDYAPEQHIAALASDLYKAAAETGPHGTDAKVPYRSALVIARRAYELGARLL